MNPFCLQGDCPAGDVVGPQRGSLHDGNTLDPLLVFLPQCVYNMSAGEVKKFIQDAMDAYVLREFNGKLGENGRLEIYPVLPSPGPNTTWEQVLKNIFSHDATVGALLDGNPDLPNIMADPNFSQDHKKFIQERLKKYQGEEGEEASLLGFINTMIGNEGAIIHSHKSELSLLEDKLEKNQNLTPEERLDTQFAILGLQPDKSLVKTQVEDLVNKYFGGLGPRSILEIEAVITNVTADTTGNRHEKAARKKDMEILQSELNQNQNSPSPSSSLNPFDLFYFTKLRKQLNQHKRERDVTVIRPDFKTLVQAEVKTVTANVSRMVDGALDQLRRGQEEIKRVHGHLLDQDWTFFGMIALPNLTSQDRHDICNRKNICSECKQFILVGNITNELTSLFANHFTSKFPDESTWRPAYVSLLSRMLSMVAMVPSLPGDRITGTNEPLVGGFSDKDIINLLDCNMAEIQKWRDAGHRGSPVKVLFFNKMQVAIWRERRMAFLADYGVGKTTLLSTKAVSLAKIGYKVGVFFLHEGDGGIEPVMGVWNKKKFASLSSNIIALSTVDLRQFYRSKGGNLNLSGIQLVRYYLEFGPSHIEQVFIDEAGMEMSGGNINQTATVQALKQLSDQIPGSCHLWVAYHSQHLLEEAGITSPANRPHLESVLTTLGFTIPSLFHNMRNTDQVARATAALLTIPRGMDPAIPAPRAPPSLTPPCKPLYIKCKSSSDFGAGVVRGYRHIQATSNAAAPPVVVLCSRYYSDSVRTCLVAEGVPVTTYWSQQDRVGLMSYLQVPVGVLLTIQDTFSGMEAVHVIIVSGVYRGALLRATQRLMLVSAGIHTSTEEMRATFEIDVM